MVAVLGGLLSQSDVDGDRNPKISEECVVAAFLKNNYLRRVLGGGGTGIPFKRP